MKKIIFSILILMNVLLFISNFSYAQTNDNKAPKEDLKMNMIPAKT